MIKSMTAFGRASGEIEGAQWTIELHSINQKGLNVNIYTPKEMMFFDVELRKWIAEAITRGQITIRLYIKNDGIFSKSSFENLKELKKKWSKLAAELGYANTAIDLSFLTKQLETETAFEIKNEEAIKKKLKSLFSTALNELMKMKQTEGENLAKDIQGRLKKIQKELAVIANKAKNVPEKYKEKLKEKLQSLLQGVAVEENRLYQEVALIAEKVDITEELERLDSHLKQFFELLKGKEKSIGRTADFILQEMAREVNTMASKSDLEIGKLCIGIKSEIEKIKEQIQNIE